MDNNENIITDEMLRNLENDCVKALYRIILGSDIQLKSANYNNDNIPTMRLDFGVGGMIIITVSAKLENNEHETK